jgi:hypothetical protein
MHDPRAAVTLAGLACLVMAGCGAGGGGESAAVPSAPAPTTALEKLTEDFDPGLFTDPTAIDNPWLPLRPGMQLVHEGQVNEDGGRVAHSIVRTVTDLTKVVHGVRTVVVYELDYTEDVLVESELAFFAQDDDGNVWHFGEYPEEWEEGAVAATPAWISGVAGAKAGIAMQAQARLGTPSYAQGWGPAVDWADRARVAMIEQETCVPAGCYPRVLVVEEFSRDEPDAFQLKYYAPGVGNVRVGWAGANEKDQETLELVRAVPLSSAELAAVRAEALKQEARAYEFSKDVYGTTETASPEQ